MHIYALFEKVNLTLVTAGILAGASPTPNHNHQHLHAVRRAEVSRNVDVQGPTVVAYVVDGKVVSHNDICQGISAGNLQWNDPNDGPSADCSLTTTGTLSAPPPTTTTIEIMPSSVAIQQKQEVKESPIESSKAAESSTEQARTTSSQPATTTPMSPQMNTSPDRAQGVSTYALETSAPEKTFSETSSPATPPETSSLETSSSETPSPETTSSETSSPETSSPETTSSETTSPETSSPETTSSETTSSETSSPETSSSQSVNISEGQGLELEFPDGEIDCSTFPSQYGPIEVEWANLGGWSGIQYVTVEGASVTHIVTAVPGGKGCIPGAMCSYACPPGYQKSQWPSTQGSTGQSVGGIRCNTNGKLSLTNPELSKTLCMKGTGATIVQNKLSYNAAICRTDYPGTENEIIPLNTQPESTSPLTCPDAKHYFEWNGLPTSAQYYINNQGIAVHDACTWGTDGSGMGNWAPSYLGVGRDRDERTWLSISSTAQNNPSSYSPLNYTVTIQGHISGSCRVSNGKYCSGDNYNDCNDLGCTVELLSGQGTYVLSN